MTKLMLRKDRHYLRGKRYSLPIEALSAGGPPLLRKLLRLGLVR